MQNHDAGNSCIVGYMVCFAMTVYNINAIDRDACKGIIMAVITFSINGKMLEKCQWQNKVVCNNRA